MDKEYKEEYDLLKERIEKVYEEYSRFNIRYCSDSIIVALNDVKIHKEKANRLLKIIDNYLHNNMDTSIPENRSEQISNTLAELKRIIQIMEDYLKDINKTIYDIPEQDENKLREFLSRKDLSIKEGKVFLARLGMYEELYRNGKNAEEIKETIDILKSKENEKTRGRIITDLLKDFEFIRKMEGRTDEDIIKDLNIFGDEINNMKIDVFFHRSDHSESGFKTEKWDDERCIEIKNILEEATNEFNEQQLILNGIYFKKNFEVLSNADKTRLGEMSEEYLVGKFGRLNKTTDKYKDMEIKELLIELYYTTELVKGYIDRASKKIEDLKKNPSRSENVQQPNSEGFEPDDYN